MTSLPNKSTNQPDGFLIYYQGFLAVASVLIFFTKLDEFLAKAYGLGIPLLWLLAFIAASIPLWLSFGSRIQYFPVPIIVWSGFYLGMTALTILLLPELPDLQLLEDSFRSFLALFLMILLFSQYEKVLHWSRLAVLGVTLMNVVNHIYEFLNPTAFGALHVLGRPAGFYLNSNQAGCALITGMVLTIDLVKPRYRIFYALFVLVGTALTFSRGALMSWFIVSAFMLWKKVIPKYQTVYLGMAIIAFIMILLSNANNLAYVENADGTALFNEDTLTRIEFLTDPLSDNQDTSRLDIADESWQKFTTSPFYGLGLGGAASEHHLSETGVNQEPHNMYLTLIVEYGFLGIFLYPGLLLASIWKIEGKLKYQAWAFFIFYLVWGIFSHTVFDSFVTIFALALMSSLTAQSKKYVQ